MHKTLIILDWDDTLFPTSWVVQNGLNLADVSVQNKFIVYFARLDMLLHKILNNLISKIGKVIIVTNAKEKWIDISTMILPNTKKLIKDNIKVISARDIYSKKIPGNMHLWKKIVFRKIVDTYYYNAQNIISVGDAEYEFNALIDLYDPKKPRLIKSVRFVQLPSFDKLIKELEVLDNCIDDINNSKTNIDLLITT